MSKAAAFLALSAHFARPDFFWDAAEDLRRPETDKCDQSTRLLEYGLQYPSPSYLRAGDRGGRCGRCDGASLLALSLHNAGGGLTSTDEQ